MFCHLVILILSALASASQGPWQQCGGINWSGATTCVDGWNCLEQNPYYSQCLQSSTAGSISKVSSTLSIKSVVASPAQGPWQQCGGVNWSGGTACVDGWECLVQNPYYSQCLQGLNSPISSISSTICATSSSKAVEPSTISKPTASTSPKHTSTSSSVVLSSASTTSYSVVPSSKSPTSPSVVSSSTSPATSGLIFKASFTHYGAGDTFGSPNCNTNTAACGFFTSPGFSVAVSQNIYGVGPGAGAGPACGTCWQLTGQADSSGNALTNAGTTIVVMVNNLCPANGNPLCAQNGLSGTNQYGANVNFDLCSDSGAEAAFFGNDGVGLAIGTAVQVDCSKYSGTVVH